MRKIIVALISGIFIVLMFKLKFQLNDPLFGKIVTIGWFLLFAYCCINVLVLIAPKKIDFNRIVNKLHLKKILIIVAVAYIILSLFKSYYLGGDDTRVFYIYPEKYLTNFSSNIATNVGVSSIINFLPPACIYYFSLLMVFLKKIFFAFNLQSLLYAVNNVLGVYFFYKMLKYLTKEEKFNFLYFLSSMLYVYSVFNVYVLFSAKLLSIYLISIAPFSILFLTKAIKEGKFHYVVLVAILWTVFSAVIISLPWFSALIVVLLPLLFWICRKNLKNLFIATIILSTSLFLFNINWIVDIGNSKILQRTQGVNGSSIVSEEFRKENASGIETTASLNRPFYPLFNLFHRQIQINHNWPYLPMFNRWYLKLVYVNWIFFAVVVIAGLLVKKTKNLNGIYYASVLSFFVSIYFYTVNFGNSLIGNFGIKLFVLLNDYIPGFVMYRNMYDKFAFSMSFTYALVFAVSLAVILNVIKDVQKRNLITVVVMFLVLLNIKPAVFGDNDKLPIWTTAYTFSSIEGFNSDYINMTEYISKTNDYSKYLSLPLAHGNVTAIHDVKKKDHYYTGVSPLLIMAGKNDFSGIMSFGAFEDDVRKAIDDKNYENVGRIFQILNIRYINVNHMLSDELKRSYIYGAGLYNKQDEAFYKEILGDKIIDFGSSYSLYKINSKYDSAKIIGLTNPSGITDLFKEFKYNRISDSKFEFDFTKDGSVKNIVFLEPYNDNWSLYINELKVDNSNHQIVYGYANGWDLEKLPDGEHHAVIYFEHARYKPYTNFTSLFAGMCGLVYFIVAEHRRKTLV